MPDDLGVPDWVSEPGSSGTRPDESRVTHHDDSGLRRAELRRPAGRRREGSVGRRAAPRRGSVEMVPTAARSGHATRAHRRLERPGPTSARIFARRRLVAALALTASLAMFLWALWPSAESIPAARGTADIAPASLARAGGAEPTPAAEELGPTVAAPATPGPSAAPVSGSGRLDVVALPAIAAPTVSPTSTVRVGLQVERGAGVDAAAAAKAISATLGDARGWQDHDRVRFRAVGAAEVQAGAVDITIVLASPTLTDKLCAPLKTRGQVSCFNLRKVVLNLRRWTEGVPGYGADLTAYRQYMVNHEVGHGLYHGHVECPRKGAVAPIMLQQSKGLDGCRPNPWPSAG